MEEVSGVMSSPFRQSSFARPWPSSPSPPSALLFNSTSPSSALLSPPTSTSNSTSPPHFSFGSASSAATSTLSSSSAVQREREFLLREERKVRLVQESMVQCEELTEAMVDILEALDHKLKTLQSSMTPLHRGTEGLILAQKNLDVTLSETERVISYVAVATEFDDDSSSVGLSPTSPSSTSASPLNPLSSRHISSSPSSFLHWLQSVNAALTYFTQHSQFVHSSLYVKKLKELQRRAVVELEKEFERLMAQHSKPLEIARLQWPLSGEGVEWMAPSIVAQLAAIAGGMSDCGVTAPFIGCTVRERSAALRATVKRVIKDENLNPLRDAEEARNSGGGGQKTQGESQLRGGESKGGAEDREVSQSSLSSSRVTSSAASMPPSTPQHATASGAGGAVALLNNKASAALTVKEREKVEERRRHELYRKGTHVIIFHVTFFLAVVPAERQLLHSLLLPTSLSEEENSEEFNRLFSEVEKEALAYLVRKEEDKIRNWGKVEFKQENRILALLDITQHCTNTLQQLRAIFPRAEAVQPFNEFTHLLLSTLKRQLSDYTAYIATFDDDRQGGGRKKAKDGSVYVLTMELLQLLRRLGDYQEVLEGMARSALLPDSADSQLPGAKEKAERERLAREKREKEETAEFERLKAKGKVTAQQVEGQAQRERERQRRVAREELKSSLSSSVYGSLVLHLLLTLEGNLELRAKALKSPSPLASIFLLNNSHYITQFLQRHHLALAHLTRYQHLQAQHAILDYRYHTWGPILAVLPSAAEADVLAGQLAGEQSSGGGGGDKAKKAIKAVFASFNQQLEELYATQRLFSVTDPALRAELRQGNAALILPRYRPVWDKLSNLPFTTKANKYCKFAPAVVESMIGNFFDG